MGLIDASMHKGLIEILEIFVGWSPAEELAKRWVRKR
jgi:hypothetical protein